MKRLLRLGQLAVVWSLVSWLCASSIAQSNPFDQDFLSGGELPSLSSALSAGQEKAEKVTLSASYELERGSEQGRIKVTAGIAPQHHVYSTTQPDGGPIATKIQVLSNAIELVGPFVPDNPPTISKSEYFTVPIEEHHGTVTWTAPMRVKSPLEPEAVLPVKVSGQVCLADGNCQLIQKQLDAGFEDFYGGTAEVFELRPENMHAVWSASIVPAQVRPGDRAQIVLKVVTDPGYHVYTFDPDSKSSSTHTLILASQKAGLRFGKPKSDQEVTTKEISPEFVYEYHPGPTDWTIPIQVPDNAELGHYPIELMVGFNTCNERSCDVPAGVRLSGTVLVADERLGEPSKMKLESIPWNTVAGHPNLSNWIDQSANDLTVWQRMAGSRLEWWMVGAALLGGFILNFMPCVLPVIGLKLMGFVNQSGSSHARVVSLNLAFVAGVLAVFIALAALNIAFKLTGQAFGWGEQFNRIEFQLGLTVLLFAMSLSFLGVWEIPIPGFATGTKSSQLMQREGISGAFYKGMLTTILATPCSGPFLGTLFGLTLTLSVWSILALFCLVGLGLGLPYLALCLWPGFVNWLPKPGAWMETLKEILAFPLLLTVVYFVSVISPDYRIAALTLLIAVWFGCWLLGRIPSYAPRRKRMAGWITAVGTCALTGWISFTYFGPAKHYLPWQEYSEVALVENRAEGNVVMVEFTARWCLTCQYNLLTAIDRPGVAEVVKQNRVVPLLADWSDRGEPIAEKLRELESNSIPLLAIYPADPDAEPIILRDVITEAQLIEALKQAGPSKSSPRLTSQSDFH